VSEIISKDNLLHLLEEWIAAGGNAAGPVQIKPDLVLFAPLKKSGDLLLDGFIHPSNSIKELVFPKHEALYGYRIKGNDVELREIDLKVPEQLIIASRPCDAASLPILDPVFNWDFKDEFYNRRRQATTVVSLACKTHDDYCFCTSVGLGPAAERGSDALLLDLGNGSFQVKTFTERGRKLFQGRVDNSIHQTEDPVGPTVRFDPQRVAEYLQSHFEDPFWREQTLRCLGCGSCAFSCPTCHCFDIVDEGNAAGGWRVKNWDACQFPLFTLHASGHNPRSIQPNRQRQRVFHKFRIYPEKFQEILCTGCGNCTRNCPVHLGVQSVLESIPQNSQLSD
jgi:ferredoxin